MSTETRPSLVPAATSPPDTFFAVMVGIYTAFLSAPLVAASSRLLGSAGGVQLLSTFLGGHVIVAISALLVRRYPGFPERLGATRLAWLPTVLPPATFVVYVGAGVVFARGAVEGPVWLLALFTTLGAVFVGGALTVMAYNRHARALVSEYGALTEWSSPLPPRLRRKIEYGGYGTAIVGGVALLAGFFWDVAGIRIAGNILFLIGIVAVVSSNESTYRVTPVGLERKLPAQRRLYAWSAFRGYELTDDALVVRFESPLRIDFRCDRARIEDVDAVTEHLDGYLERL